MLSLGEDENSEADMLADIGVDQSCARSGLSISLVPDLPSQYAMALNF